MTLKNYYISNDLPENFILSQLNDEIRASGFVTNYSGCSVAQNYFLVHGDSMDETGLDSVISSHVPNLMSVFVSNTIQQNKAFADDMMERMKKRNILEGLSSIDQAAWVHHRLRKVDYILNAGPTVQIDVLNLVVSGDIETAEHVMGQMTPDSMLEVYHWLNQDRIDWIRNEIRTFLGWPLI